MPSSRGYCAWVVDGKDGRRACAQTPAYIAQGRRYCGRHARLAGDIEGRLLPARRSLYEGRSAARPCTVEPVYLINLLGARTMPFEVEAKAGGEFNAEDYAPPGIYVAVVESVLPYEGTKYMSDEKQTQARITWTITDGPFSGKKAERLYSPSLNEKARLYPVFQALTGITPTPGERYDIEALLKGKPSQIVVMNHTTQAGAQRTRVENVLPVAPAIVSAATAAPAKPKKTKVVEVEVDDDDDDDLADA